MKTRCLTNNPLVIQKHLANVESIEGNCLSVLEVAKKEVIKGHKLLSHPLTGSIRPDISPYKTVIISGDSRAIDYESLEIIEKAIEYTHNLYSMKSIQIWTEDSLKDFQIIDLDLVKYFI